MKTVIVGSANPVKVNCTKEALQKCFPDEGFEVSGMSVPSDVPDQPIGEDETLQGARNRIINCEVASPGADFYVGIEGGLLRIDNEYEAFAWIVVKNHLQEGKAKTATFPLPPAICSMIDDGMELGHADDVFFKRTNSKKGNGAVGILTNNLISRTDYYTHAVLLALIPFINKDYFINNG